MLTIGAFSRLAQLSIRVLRHYDEIGLLKPARTSRANGYRYYATEQLLDVHRIIALKELGLSLEQVRTVMNQKLSVKAIRGMLELEKMRAEEARALAERRLCDLDRRLRELTDLGQLSDLDIVEKSLEPMPFLAYRTTVATMDDAFALMHEVLAVGEQLRPGQALVAVGHDPFFDTENLDLELGFAIPAPASFDLGGGRWLKLRELEGVERMLSVMHVGTEEEGHRRCHRALALWLEDHECELAGPGREIVHTSDRDRMTVEIQYPIAAVPPAASRRSRRSPSPSCTRPGATSIRNQ